MIKTTRVESVPAFIQAVCEQRRKWTRNKRLFFNPWFRGQTDASWTLEPSIYRLDLDEQEIDLRLDFVRRAAMMTEREPNTEWGWYFLMQHYGLPTRLLDWTDSALIGLFFATSSYRAGYPSVTADAAVWMLDPYWLNMKVLRREEILDTDMKQTGLYLPRLSSRASVQKPYPAAIDPPHLARRISAQHSRFTVYGTERDGLTALGRQPGSRLLKIVIPRDAIDEIRVDLGTCGIGDTTLFPELDGLAREITKAWTETWK